MNLRDVFPRIRALVAPQRVERELDEDLAFHIERETQKHIAAGLSPVERSYPSARALRPGPACRRPVSRRSWHRFVDDLARDILYALRTFRRAPLAALTIIATVALGLGLVTAVFASTTSSCFASMPCGAPASCLPWRWSSG